ncbi:hypothetical protein BOW52_07600 [Solemya elarraichensis gill symbiont]|uniref:ATP-grasp domain-containing protein n=2 Tax=Solemya elarraichensis gill symbiont TaxID=1918949 RepID=A0A1T2L244_9GAMM|nr:hypothetical protein BOW52_07600 [Solemya elarraichensis gill symbiont]
MAFSCDVVYSKNNDKTTLFLPNCMHIQTRVFHGPNQYADMAGVVMEFEPLFNTSLSANAIDTQWEKLNEGNETLWMKQKPDEEISFTDLSAAIASYLHQPVALKHQACVAHGQSDENAASWVIVCHYRLDAAHLILHSSITLAKEIFSGIFTGRSNIDTSKSKPVENIRQRIARLHATPTRQVLMDAAVLRDIPFYPISTGGNIWQYGQGIFGKHYRSAANEFDSYTGGLLCRNKVWSNQLIHSLGFPGTVHGVAHNFSNAEKIASEIGYPVVVKPIDGGMGRGITASIDTPSILHDAFRLAAKHSQQGVIVERHVKGIDHRLSVFGGQLAWVNAKTPARVIGDGIHSVRGLIELDNQLRQSNKTGKQIVMDNAMNTLLAKNGLSFDYCPTAGEVVYLRSVANTSMGGGSKEVTDRIHPDNREMAETLARAFRMDAIGIDFITENISCSWRDSECAVIEVNQTPGVLNVPNAEKVLLRMFPPGSEGRMPTVLLIDPPRELAQHVAKRLIDADFCVGQATDSQTLLGDCSRGKTTDTLQARVNSLILNPQCEALVVIANADSIMQNGLPLDRFDLTLIERNVPSDIPRCAPRRENRRRVVPGSH